MAKKTSKEKFHEFYGDIYGDRWLDLIDSFNNEKEYVGLQAPGVNESLFKDEMFPGCFFVPQKIESNDYYYMDPASVVAAINLEVEDGDDVLDLCAAPGGKSILLARSLKTSGSLTSNEVSANRRGRLKRNLEKFLTPEVFERVRVTAHDATQWCLHEKDAYDKILLDAPCSSERHVLESAKHLGEWSEKRSKGLATKQFAMLASALDVVRVGGRIVYSTCALSPYENDGVVEKLHKKREGRFKLIKSDFLGAEKTKYGNFILPDKNKYGPIFYCIIERTS